MNLDVQRFLEDLSGRYAKAYTSTIEDMMLAKVRDNSAAFDAAGKSMLETVEQTMGIAEVLGATSLLREAAGVLAGDEGGAFARDKPYLVHFADEPAQNILPRVTLSEAVQDMVDRTPTTIRNAAERTALRISHLYSRVRPQCGAGGDRACPGARRRGDQGRHHRERGGEADHHGCRRDPPEDEGVV
ncbi:MAG: hypothetical protein ACPGWS_04055 [Solirubrobacterales bacterium]